MNTFTRSISQVFKGAVKAFRTFPASIGCALMFAIVTMIRIQLDWPQQEPYNFLFNCLHWSFAMGAVFSLAAITAAQSRYNSSRAFLIANLLGVAAAAVTFIGLYYFGISETASLRYDVISSLAAARVGAAMLISFIAFILLAGYPKDQSDFSSSFFMTHKAFFIALLYGAVILAGTTGVARAVQFLLYRDMSSKVYMYIGTLVGFMTYTIFVGYFPDFRKGVADERREIAQKQPLFIKILFLYIMIPIMIAFTVVLLIWAGKTVLSGMNVPFVQLSSIAAAYTIGGLWLHVMVTEYDTGLSKFYKRVYPIASLVILAFEAWAVIHQLGLYGLKLTEYIFILIWIVAAIGSVLLLIIKSKAHKSIAIITCAMAVIAVLPFIGYNALPVTAQVNRLEKLLVSQGMLESGNLKPASAEPDRAVRESITDSVLYLAYTSDAKLPAWFNKDLTNSSTFKKQLGFEQTWPDNDLYPDAVGRYIGTYLNIPPEAVDISGYKWALNPVNEKQQGYMTLDGDKGTYQIYWTANNTAGLPTLKILLDDRVILEQDMNAYIDEITAKYPPAAAASYTPTAEDMCLRIETSEVSVLLIFRYIDISIDTSTDIINYWFDLNAMYLNENP